MSVAFPDWMHGIQTRVESALAHRLPAAEAIPARLHQAMRYASLGGGKRIRPLLAFAAGELTPALVDSFAEHLSTADIFAFKEKLIHTVVGMGYVLKEG